MTYAIIGTGAIGGYYGGRLAQSGQEVHFLLHSDYEHVCQNGLRVDSCDGSFHLEKVNVYHSTADMPKADVVLVCLKSTRNHLLPTLLPPLLKDDTIVVLIQNGIGLEADLQAQFPRLSIAAGLAFICSSKIAPGHISHQCYGSINIGNYSCKGANASERLNTLLSDLHAAGIEAGQVEYHEARWKKAVWNMPFNGMTVALQTQTDKLLANPATRSLIRRQMGEVCAIAQILGVRNVDDAFAEKMMTTTDAMTPYSPSMRLDFDFHRPMEIDYIYTRPIAIAHKAGLQVPLLEMLEAELRFIQSTYME